MTPKALLALSTAVVLIVAGCGGSDGDTARPMVAPAEIADLEDGTEVATQGFLIATGETRLCELPAESFPPQCGGGSVLLDDLDVESVVALQTVPDSQGVQISWTTYPLAVGGTVEDGVLVATEVAGPVYEAIEDGLRVRLLPAQTSSVPDPLNTGEDVWWAIDVTNTGDGPVPLTFTSGQRAEVTISDGDVELYQIGRAS